MKNSKGSTRSIQNIQEQKLRVHIKECKGYWLDSERPQNTVKISPIWPPIQTTSDRNTSANSATYIIPWTYHGHCHVFSLAPTYLGPIGKFGSIFQTSFQIRRKTFVLLEHHKSILMCHLECF